MMILDSERLVRVDNLTSIICYSKQDIVWFDIDNGLVFISSGDDEKLILCDECNKAFHLFCLRPALYRIPDGEWRCLACQPTVARRGSRSR